MMLAKMHANLFSSQVRGAKIDPVDIDNMKLSFQVEFPFFVIGEEEIQLLPRSIHQYLKNS